MLIDRILVQARWHPDRIAHRSGDRSFTYGELLERSAAVASWLQERHGDARGPVAVHGHKEPEMLAAFLGAARSGRPYVPIDSSLPTARVEAIVRGAQPQEILTPAVVAELPPASDSDSSFPGLAAEDPLYILFTSGSTGEPKGVVITLGNLEHFVAWMLSEQPFVEGQEVFLNQAPFSFDLSVMDLYCSLATGGTLFSLTKDHIANPKALYGAFAASGVTSWVSTPSFAQMCLVERTFAEPMLPALRRFLFCGETLAPETASQLLDRFPTAEVWNTYGPTEATVATTSIRIDRAVLSQWSPLPVGHAMPGTRVEIFDESQSPCAEGVRGEIIISGPNVSPGYLGHPDLNEKAFFPWQGVQSYRTGDWGTQREGLIFFEGRMDGQIKLHGFRIEIGDLEANLRALPEIADAVVLPVSKGGKIDSLAAIVVLAGEKEGSDFQISARLKTALAERLPAYMLPRKFIFTDAFPLTANGKADRKKLTELLG